MPQEYDVNTPQGGLTVTAPDGAQSNHVFGFVKALGDAGFWSDVGNRLSGALKSGLNDVFPNGVRSQAMADATGRPVDPKYDEKMLNMGLAGLTVYHGSPHSFDAFDSSKIGTGEGAQAYGHGLYLAENPQIADQYRQALSTYDTTLNGKPLTPDHPLFSAAMNIGSRGYDETLKMTQNAINSRFITPEFGAQELANIKSLKGANIQSVKQGSVYKVDLPDEHIAKMLDWDKPMSEQTAHVQDAFKKAGFDFTDPYWKAGGYGEVTGADIMKGLSAGGNGVSASKTLNQAGIPGIKYLDQGSRSGGAGTRNFVVFDDKLPKILGKQ